MTKRGSLSDTDRMLDLAGADAPPRAAAAPSPRRYTWPLAALLILAASLALWVGIIALWHVLTGLL